MDKQAQDFGDKPSIISKAKMFMGEDRMALATWWLGVGGQERCISQVLGWLVTALRRQGDLFWGLGCHRAPMGGGTLKTPTKGIW